MSKGEVPDEREIVIAEMFPRLVTYFRLRHAGDPEDLAQETVMRALGKVKDPRTKITVPLPAYVYGIARNVWLESLRGGRETPMDPEDPKMTGLSKAEASPDNAILLEQKLSRLPDEERRFILDFHLRGAQPIAGETGQTANAIRIRAYRIHKKLKEA